MTVKECYEAIDGNYEEVISRLRSDDRVKKFVLKFIVRRITSEKKY